MRKVVRKDLKNEIAEMRAHEDGCTDKCRIKNKLLELDLARHKSIVQHLVSFQWCPDCTGEASAVSSVCKVGCGKKLMT